MLRGEAGLAFAWPDEAVDYHDPGVYDIGSEPFFATIHSAPRRLSFLRKIGVAEQLARIEYKVSLPPERREQTNGAALHCPAFDILIRYARSSERLMLIFEAAETMASRSFFSAVSASAWFEEIALL